MIRHLQGPITRAVALAAVLVASIGIVRVVYVGPRVRESNALRAREALLRTELDDLQRGAREIQGAPNGSSQGVRRALPARDMVSGFLKALGPIAARHGIWTESIEPTRAEDEVEAGDAASGSVYRKVALRLRIAGAYRDLAEYVADVERIDQVVLVRSVTIRFDPSQYPRLESEVIFWVYGAS